MRENKPKKEWVCRVCGTVVKNGDKVHCGVWNDPRPSDGERRVRMPEKILICDGLKCKYFNFHEWNIPIGDEDDPTLQEWGIEYECFCTKYGKLRKSNGEIEGIRLKLSKNFNQFSRQCIKCTMCLNENSLIDKEILRHNIYLTELKNEQYNELITDKEFMERLEIENIRFKNKLFNNCVNEKLKEPNHAR